GGRAEPQARAQLRPVRRARGVRAKPSRQHRPGLAQGLVAGAGPPGRRRVRGAGGRGRVRVRIVNAVRNPLPPSAPDPGTHRDLPALVAAIRRRNRLLTVVTLALALYGFYAARTLIVPIVFSILVSLVLAP